MSLRGCENVFKSSNFKSMSVKQKCLQQAWNLLDRLSQNKIILVIIAAVIGIIICWPGFSMSVESSGAVRQGGSIETIITVKNKGIIPYKEEIEFRSEHSSDIHVVFEPKTKKPDFKSKMIIQTNVNIREGLHKIKITGYVNEDEKRNIEYNLTVISPTPTPSPSLTPTLTPTPLPTSSSSPTPTPTPEVTITDPPDGSKVPMTFTAQGTITSSVSNPEIWVIIHPMQTNRFWVEPRADLNQENGTWRTLIYIGESEIGIGEQFEIMAIANPTQTLTQTPNKDAALYNWPEAQMNSEIIRVTRE